MEEKIGIWQDYIIKKRNIKKFTGDIKEIQLFYNETDKFRIIKKLEEMAKKKEYVFHDDTRDVPTNIEKLEGVFNHANRSLKGPRKKLSKNFYKTSKSKLKYYKS